MPGKVIEEVSPSLLPAYLANGVIGLRCTATLNGRWCTVNGFVGVDPADGIEAWQYAPDPVGFDIRVGSWRMSQRPDSIEFVRQEYDFIKAELVTHLRFDGADIRVQTICCRAQPLLVLQQIEICVSRATSLEVSGLLDPSKIRGESTRVEVIAPHEKTRPDALLEWRSAGRLSRVGLSMWTEIDDPSFEARRDVSGSAIVASRWAGHAEAGKTYRFRQVTAVVPDVMHNEPVVQAERLAMMGRHYGFDRLLSEHRAQWSELWTRRPMLEGRRQDWQEVLDASYFYLHSSIHPSSPCSTGLLGLGQWPGYHCFRGHVFWDIDFYAFPAVLLSEPRSARAMIDYRWRHLDEARMNARMQGYDGILFPWQSTPRSGIEGTPPRWPLIVFEHHINMNVAYAFARYAHATADVDFLRDRAWPVLSEVAQWICSRVRKTARGYELLDVMGVCENMVSDNNAFTNMAVACILREAVNAAERVGRSAPTAWTDIAEKLWLERDTETGRIRGYSRLSAMCHGPGPTDRDFCTETLAGLYPYTHRLDQATTEATLEHYLSLGERGMGWPMMPPLLSVHAARTGDRRRAAWFVDKGCMDYVVEPYLMLDEYGRTMTQNKPKVGPYLAHCGANVMNFLIGFPGLEIRSPDPRDWPTHRVTLPDGVDAIHARIVAGERQLQLRAVHGDDRATLTPCPAGSD